MEQRLEWTGRIVSSLLLLIAAFLGLQIYTASNYNADNLSRQGCTMSYMTPSYILQSSFDSSWTHLARRYSLWLYREVGWDSEELSGMPVLFVPGNAGSSRQVRSIASSATRQFYSFPHVKSQDFSFTNHTTLDFFAAEFNEDFSALHGPTLLSQKAYVEASIRYILSRYTHLPNPPTQVMVIGHSMGGVVAASLLPSNLISVVITLSSPHSLPPARVDRRIEDLYADVARSLYAIPVETKALKGLSTHLTPVLSICGGAPDPMIPGETCYLPPAPTAANAVEHIPYRKTVFTSGIDVTWTGVGHVEMMWCHQLRWRVARVALDLTAATSLQAREAIMDKWFFPSAITSTGKESFGFAELNVPVTQVRTHKIGERLKVHATSLDGSNEPRLYLFPLSNPTAIYRMTLLSSRFPIIPFSESASSIRPKISLFSCDSTSDSSEELDPQNLHCQGLSGSTTSIPVLPRIPRRQPAIWPEYRKGADEDSTGAVFTSNTISGEKAKWIALRVEIPPGKENLLLFDGFEGLAEQSSGSNTGEEWGGVKKFMAHNSARLAPFSGTVSITLSNDSTDQPLIIDVHVPNVVINALVVYRLTPVLKGGSKCEDSILPPMLQNLSPPSEFHFHPLNLPSMPIYIHTHSSGPFIQASAPERNSLNFKIYQAGHCTVESLELKVDWYTTIGRWGIRYYSVPITWGLGVILLMMFKGWRSWERGERFPSPTESYYLFVTKTLPYVAASVFLSSLLPMPVAWAFLGNGGEALAAPLSLVCLLLSVGLVGGIWRTLQVLMFVLGFVGRPLGRPGASPERASSRSTPILSSKRYLASLAFLLVLVALFIPYQVAFLISFCIMLWTCSNQGAGPTSTVRSADEPALSLDAVQLQPARLGGSLSLRRRSPSGSPSESPGRSTSPLPDNMPPSIRVLEEARSSYHLNLHILLLQTFLLPLLATVLVVWIRTLATAGYTAPFDGDHNIFMVGFWLVLVEAASVKGWERARWKWRNEVLKHVVPTMFALTAGFSLLSGVRYTFVIFELINLVMGWIVVTRMYF